MGWAKPATVCIPQDELLGSRASPEQLLSGTAKCIYGSSMRTVVFTACAVQELLRMGTPDPGSVCTAQHLHMRSVCGACAERVHIMCTCLA